MCPAIATDSFNSLFAPESQSLRPRASIPEKPWKVLLVDDEDDMHAVLHMALEDMEVEGFPLQLLDAWSAEEAKQLLAKHPDIALILLDVVMETELAGLSLVTYVREVLTNQMMQIFLVTGQPGHAQEHEVRSEYDINGYRLKSELSAYNIYASVNLSVCAYKTLRDLRDNPPDHAIHVQLRLEQAIEAHRQWLAKLHATALAGETLDPEALRRNDCCELGRWLHTYGHKMYGKKPEFIKLLARHNDFHQSASMVAHAINGHEYADVEKMINRQSQLGQASMDVEVAIMRLQLAQWN